METPFVKIGDLFKQVLDKHFIGDSPIETKLAGWLFRFGAKVELQKQIGKHRVDIFIQTEFNKIVVECDGAEFHTDKEKDKKRDEDLMDAGCIVLRFTGSQINRNAEGCAVRVIENISEIYQTQRFQDYLEKKLNQSVNIQELTSEELDQDMGDNNFS